MHGNKTSATSYGSSGQITGREFWSMTQMSDFCIFAQQTHAQRHFFHFCIVLGLHFNFFVLKLFMFHFCLFNILSWTKTRCVCRSGFKSVAIDVDCMISNPFFCDTQFQIQFQVINSVWFQWIGYSNFTSIPIVSYFRWPEFLSTNYKASHWNNWYQSSGNTKLRLSRLWTGFVKWTVSDVQKVKFCFHNKFTKNTGSSNR